MQARTLIAAALAASALMPVTALAQQSADVASDRADALASRNLEFGGAGAVGASSSDSMADAPKEESPHKFSVVFAAPLAYSSNPERVSSNSDGDGHITPAATVKYEYVNQLGGTFSVSGGGLLDLNLDRQANDSTILSASVEYKAPPSAMFAGAAPYVNYGFQDIYQKQFGNHIITNHTGAVGLTFKTADPKKPIKVSWTLEAARREASLATGNQNRFRASGGLEGGVVLDSGKTLVLSGSLAVLHKDYSGGTAKTRDDTAYTLTGVLIYPISAAFQARVIAQYEHNSSDVALKDYDVVDIGLQLRAAF